MARRLVLYPVHEFQQAAARAVFEQPDCAGGSLDGRANSLVHLVALDLPRRIAVDGDALVVDRLYRDLRESDGGRIVPLVMDLIDGDCSPYVGFCR